MIYDTLNNLPNYLGMSDNLDAVIEFVMARDINNLPAGKTRIDGDKAVVTVSTVTPQTSQRAVRSLTWRADSHQAHRRGCRPDRRHRRHQHRRDALRGALCPLSGR